MKQTLNAYCDTSGGSLVFCGFCAARSSSQPGSNDQQTQSTPAPEASADAQPQTFSGTIVKTKNHYVLKTDKMTYQLDDETKAKQFEGKQVNVSGTADKSTSIIRVTDIQPAS